MPHFREVLYGNYSSAFGELRPYDLELACRGYELASRVPPVAKDAPIADLGCGKGEWLAWLQRRGFTNLRGFDLSAAELAYAQGAPVEAGEVTLTLGADRWRNHFALLHAKDLIEHLTKQETVDFLLACRYALQPGGSLWISTFNAQGIFASATRYGDFTHESGFTPTSMAQVLRATGFEVDQIVGTHHCPNTVGGLARNWIWRLVSGPARLILHARHGGKEEARVDSFSVDSDLFAAARKAPAWETTTKSG